MLISLDDNGEWVKGCTAAKIPYIALSDQSDTDVLAIGLLPALSCAGNYEIQTGYFIADSDMQAEGTPIIAATGGDAGSLKVTSDFEQGDDIVGVLTRSGRQDLFEINSECDRSSGHVYVINFITRWMPNRDT